MNPIRILLFTLLFISIPTFTMLDHHRVQQDFFALKAFLNHTRHAAIDTNKKPITRFHPKQATRHQISTAASSPL